MTSEPPDLITTTDRLIQLAGQRLSVREAWHQTGATVRIFNLTLDDLEDDGHLDWTLDGLRVHWPDPSPP